MKLRATDSPDKAADPPASTGATPRPLARARALSALAGPASHRGVVELARATPLSSGADFPSDVLVWSARSPRRKGGMISFRRADWMRGDQHSQIA